MNRKKLILLILDGWGYRAEREHNAVALSDPKNFNKLISSDPWTLLDASEERVGLPKGQMGNSEVGHTNIGAGRIVYQDILRISNDIESGGEAKNPAISGLFNRVAKTSNRLHILGLISDGGVHSHMDHIKGMIALAKSFGIKNVYVHAFTDGRDTPPSSGLGFIKDLNGWLKENNAGCIADITGRYYAMDRDKRWDRVQKAWDVLRFGKSEFTAKTPEEAMTSSSETDEFIKPVRIDGVDGAIKDGDGVFMMNFRADRVRELVHVMTDEEFSGFDRGAKPNLDILTLTEYEKGFGLPVAYPPDNLKNIFAETVSAAGLSQLRIAETEKYAHVTYFFNGGREEPFPLEARELIASPRDVATYDLKPAMSVYQVEESFEKIFRAGKTDVAIMNFANPDMVGHTGVEGAAIDACRAVDECLGRVIKTADDMDAVLLVTADHGNSEYMWDYDNNQPWTAHTLNPVAFVVHNYPCTLKEGRGKLADIAPTMLRILGIPQPEEMTGDNLII